MYKVRKIKFIDHPILKNMEFNFVGMDGKAVDTVIFEGGNRCGKSTIIDELYKVVGDKCPYQMLLSMKLMGKSILFELQEKANTRIQPNILIKMETGLI